MDFSVRMLLLFALVLLSCSHQTTGHGHHGRKMLQVPGSNELGVAKSVVDLSPEGLVGLQPGMTGENVRLLKQQLASLGYYLVKDAEPGLNVTFLSDFFDENLHTALTRFQQFNNLTITGGVVDQPTVDALLLRRCSFPDIVNENFWDGNDPNLNLVEYSVFATDTGTAPAPAGSRRLLFTRTPGDAKFFKTNLTYAFDTVNTTSDMPASEVRAAFRSALDTWQRASNLTFFEVADVKLSDIKFRFAVGNHGDGSPFSTGTLAHAFSPISGELHVNDDYLWEFDGATGARNGFDLQSVVVHELGHIFGLGHSDQKDAVMYASLPPNTDKRALTPDDTAGIQQIYGSNANKPPPPAVGGTNNPDCECAIGFTGWAMHSGGSLNCRRYCYCDTGSGSSYTCVSTLRLAADFWCYPAVYFTSFCQDDDTARASGGKLVPDTLIVDPKTTVISSRRQPVRDAVSQVADAPGTTFSNPTSIAGGSLPFVNRKLGSFVALVSAMSVTAIFSGLTTI